MMGDGVNSTLGQQGAETKGHVGTIPEFADTLGDDMGQFLTAKGFWCREGSPTGFSPLAVSFFPARRGCYFFIFKGAAGPVTRMVERGDLTL